MNAVIINPPVLEPVHVSRVHVTQPTNHSAEEVVGYALVTGLIPRGIPADEFATIVAKYEWAGRWLANSAAVVKGAISPEEFDRNLEASVRVIELAKRVAGNDCDSAALHLIRMGASLQMQTEVA